MGFDLTKWVKDEALEDNTEKNPIIIKNFSDKYDIFIYAKKRED